jgi:BMFP domain-containing protein YqiC
MAMPADWSTPDAVRRREAIERQKQIMARMREDLERRVRSLEARAEALKRDDAAPNGHDAS